MMKFIEYLQENITIAKLIISALLILINILFVQISANVLFRTLKDKSVYYMAKKRFTYFNTFILLILITLLWVRSSMNLTTYMGFLSAGIAISLREIFTNMAAWLIIILQKPFEVGDRITINNVRGDVLDVRLFQFVLMELNPIEKGEQSTGRIVMIPNNFLFLHPIMNANKGFEYIWHEIEVKISLQSNWKLAIEYLEQIVNDHSLHLSAEAADKVYEASKKYLIHYQNLTPIVYMTVRDQVVVLTLRYLCEPRQARTTEDIIWKEIMNAFHDKEEIEFSK